MTRAQQSGARHRGGQRRRCLHVGAVTITVLALAALGTALAAKPKTQHLTAHVTKNAAGASKGNRIALALEEGAKTVGSAQFPACQGTGTSVICGGTVSVKGFGSNLNTVVTFECPPKPPFKCLPGVGSLASANGDVKGTITLKTQPEKIVAGASFPATVSPAPGA